MTKKSKTKRKNIKNPFHYFKYPTFLMKILHYGKYHYKCFICKKLFKNKFRLSRHFKSSKNIKTTHSKLKDRFLKKIEDIIMKENINFDNSIIIFEKEFKQKKKEISYYYNNNTSNNKNKPIIINKTRNPE